MSSIVQLTSTHVSSVVKLYLIFHKKKEMTSFHESRLTTTV